MYTQAIPTVNDLTPMWFTALLQSDGVLDGATTVAAADVSRFGSAESMMSSLYRVALTYDGPTDAPSSLVVKLASDSPGQRFVAAMAKFYEREIRFYNEISHKMTVRVPRCYRAEINIEDQSFVLVLEEITGMRQVDQIEGLGYDNAATAISELADIHTPFWGTDLDSEAETFLRFDSPMLHEVVPNLFAADWDKARSTVIDELAPEVIEVCDNRARSTPKILRSMHGPDTLCHGDFRSDNLLFDSDGRVVALDYQLGSVAHGMTDVAYFISQSVDDEIVASRVDDLIAVYVDRLAEHGIVLDLGSGMDAYRAGLVFYLSIPISILTLEGVPERADLLARTMLRRASAEILRTGAHLQFS